MSLFQQSVLKKHLQALDKATVEAAWLRFAAHFLDVAKQENIRNSKEEQCQEGLEWEPLFEEQRGKAAALQADILRVDREIVERE